ncbi:hypothetical protein D3879_14610 [Pseudomonas cavernicola]|uniref:AntA/AntB antirepressor domain-containing protein n=1 Tax=Pseudomonas cavernicola TaxID=2320866 RepID=A0A418XEU1_9PSED|nr:antA/AntB antirepressor family protein [Pseudomonas cavernicola]RJG10910.1 hypothetical protein D3879_14610 [Pseudomonas cavernicola]
MNTIAIAVENNSGMSYSTLIPVRLGELGGEVVQLCNAKDIYLCLGVTTRFNDWIARRIQEYGFIEGQDFSMVTQNRVTKGRGGDRRSQGYSLSVDMAKELAMVERTEAGRAVRRYFIECEKKLRQIAPDVAAECLRKALNPQQQLQLSDKVHGKVACLEKARQRAGYCELWTHLKHRHQVAQYRDIPQSEFENACGFVDSYTWEGEWIGRQENPTSPAMQLSEHELSSIYLLMSRFALMYREHDRLQGVAKALDSKPLMNLFSQLHEGWFTFKSLDKRRDEFYATYKRVTGSEGGYAMRAAA